MELRTFYWDAVASAGPLSLVDRLRGRRPAFAVGNAGDLFNRDLIDHLYGWGAANAEDPARLLLVGSVAHRARSGDIVCGIGTKGAPIVSAAEQPLDIRGVRGPITLAAFEEAGHDVSGVRFAFDPGLLVGRVYADLLDVAAEPGRAVFIPHYRDRERFRSTRRYDLVDIDCEPRDLVREILRAEVVYSSSLHGIVFAHALGRPCVLVAPLNGEADVKYRDYYASVGLAWRTPGDIDAALAAGAPTSPFEPGVDLDDFAPPTRDELVAAGLVEGSDD